MVAAVARLPQWERRGVIKAEGQVFCPMAAIKTQPGGGAQIHPPVATLHIFIHL